MTRAEHLNNAMRREWYVAHRDEINARRREQYATDKARARVRRYAWAKSPEGVAYLVAYRKTPQFRIAQYRSMAEKRGVEFKLSLDEFHMFWQKPCFYCGSSIETIGLDRVDSSKGYFLGNIVSSCIKCNQAKNDLSQEEFIALCRRVVQMHDERRLVESVTKGE